MDLTCLPVIILAGTLQNAFHAEQELRIKIPAELIAEFDNCMELHLLMVMAAGQDGFIHGFRMGGKLMVQTLT